MPVRKNPSLTEILKKFNAARTKTANDGALLPPEAQPSAPEAVPPVAPVAQPEMMPANIEAEGHPAPGDLAAAAQALEVATAQAETAETVAENAKEQVCEATETLKSIADAVANEHTAALKKEAQVFGELFAASALEQMNKSAALQDLQEQAYGHTLDTLQNNNALQKEASVFDEAYVQTIVKLAGLDSVEDLQEAIGTDEPLTAADVATVLDALQEQEDESDPEEDEELDTADDSEEDDIDPEDLATAANILSAVREAQEADDSDVESDDDEDTASNAYAATMAALQE